jgi:hypothetical protein
MKRVTSQSFNTYVRPDASQQQHNEQRRQQTAGALKQLGVNVKQARDIELAEMKDASDHAKDTQSAAAAGKIKHALDWAKLDENKAASKGDLESHDTFKAAEESLAGITNTRAREHLKARLEEAKTGVLQKHSAVRRAEQKDHEESLQVGAVNAKIKLAIGQMSLPENRFRSPADFDGESYVSDAMSAIGEVEEPFLKETLLAQFAQARTGVMQSHTNDLAREDNITNFAAVTADVLSEPYDATSIDKLIRDHKEALGPDAVPELARVAIASESLDAVNHLIARATEGGAEDVAPATLASLMAAKGRIEASIAKAEKADKSRYKFDLDRANALQDRSERLDALLMVKDNHFGVMSSSQVGALGADIKTLSEDVASEQYVKENLGHLSTRELANEMPDGMRKLPLADIRKLQNKAFTDAIEEGDLPTAMTMMRDPTDIPSAAKDFFGTMLTDATVVNADEPSQGFINKFNLVKEMEGQMGPSRMRGIMSDSDYAEYQIVAGMEAQEGIQTALSRFQEYKQLVATGKPLIPENWASTKRDVVASVSSNIEGWFTGDNTKEHEVNATLTPYFKVWGAMGLSESAMKEQATRILSNTTWNGIVNGQSIHDALSAVTTGVNGTKYSEDVDDIYDDAVEYYGAIFKKNQTTITGDITVSVIPTNPNFIQFKSSDGIPIVGGIKPLSSFADLAISRLRTKKSKALDGD